jgi:hypothetical protein
MTLSRALFLSLPSTMNQGASGMLLLLLVGDREPVLDDRDPQADQHPRVRFGDEGAHAK